MSKRKTPITEEAQPKPTAELRREGRLTRIAKALASGATVTEIAEAEGHRSHARSNSAGCGATTKSSHCYRGTGSDSNNCDRDACR